MNSTRSKVVTNVLWVVLLTVLFGLPAAAQEIGEQVYDFEGVTRDGDTILLSELQGKVVIIDFWASWCGPCLLEMPFLIDLQAEFADTEFEVVAINLDEESAYMEEFLDRLDTQPQFPIVLDPEGDIAKHYDLQGMPTTVFVDRLGIASYIHTGFRPQDKETYREKLIELLDEN